MKRASLNDIYGKNIGGKDIGAKGIYGKDIDYKEVKTCSIENSYVNPNDYVAIKNLAHNLRKKYTFQFIVTFLFNALIGFLLYDFIKSNSSMFIKSNSGMFIKSNSSNFIKSNSNMFIKEFFLIVITFILFLAVLFHIGHLLYSTRNDSYKKAQYGVVKTKFFQKKTANNKVVRNYYVNVIFPNTNTFIRKVNCSEKAYNLISEGSEILVVSFDNKIAHVVLSQVAL